MTCKILTWKINNRDYRIQKEATYEYFTEKIERLDQRIEELSCEENYQEKVKKLGCLLGVKTHTALLMVVEAGDFEQFAKPAGEYTAVSGKPLVIPAEYDEM